MVKYILAQIKLSRFLPKLKVEIYAKNDALGALRIQAEAYPVENETLNHAAYESTKKDYVDTQCAAIELKNIHGTIRNKLGKIIDVNF